MHDGENTIAARPAIAWTFHGTALVHSYADALAALTRLCGCVPLEYSEAGAPISRNGGCCAIGDNLLELVEPNDDAGAPARHLARFGAGMYNLALQLENLETACAWFAAHGAAPTLPPDRHFTFTRPSETCGLQFEWSDLKSDWDPRFGGKIPARAPPLINTPRIAYWGALVADPAAAVARLSALWSVDLIFLKQDAPLNEPSAAISLGDGVFALYRLPSDPAEEFSLWRSNLGRPRFHVTALRVEDIIGARDALNLAGVRVFRDEAASGRILTEPVDSGGVPLVWTDRDIEGDPRGAYIR